MATATRMVIIGAGQAGGTAVQTLRAEGYDGHIVLVGAEPHLPYERPPLSKSYLLGEGWQSEESLRDAQWYAEHRVELRLGTTAVAINSDKHQVTLDDQTTLSYDKLLIATGSTPRHLDIPGAQLGGVHYVRTLEDSTALHGALQAKPRVVIVGASWIGLETAAAARSLGCEATVIGPDAVPLQASMGALVGGYFADLHRGHGVQFQLGRRVVALAGTTSVTSVTTDDGAEFAADVVIAGVGVRPNVALFDERLLAEDGGVRVDPQMRTEDADVFAAGDIASVANPLYGRQMRVEHWANALMDGRVAAQSMLGKDSSFDPAPFFFSDQYDMSMEYAGWVDARAAGDPLIRGDLTGGTFHALWVVGGVVVAGLHVNAWDEGIGAVQDLIRSQAKVDPEQLINTEIPLAQLVERFRR